ncbi:MAG: methionyl-tRNA formyltransferase [Firmicutes bacterium]|nr:methionyl-tRNA formyltransferase [Bacillota bacterium]
MKTTKIVFFGTPDFAVAALEALQQAFTVLAVITQPDRPAGRGRKLTAPPVKNKALALKIPVWQPESVRGNEFAARLAALEPDFLVTAAYGKLLPRSVLAVPRLAALNIHASLLPAYRGAAPIQRAVMNGEKETGITIMEMDEGMDTGAIILQEAIPIAADDTAGTVHDKLSVLGAKLIVEAIRAVLCGTAVRRRQDEAKASSAPPIQRGEARINWCAPTNVVHNLVRGMNPWPGAYTESDGKRLKIWAGQPAAGRGTPCGLVLEAAPSGILVATGDGAYRITRLQAPGKNILPAAEFLRGNPLPVGTVLGRQEGGERGE